MLVGLWLTNYLTDDDDDDESHPHFVLSMTIKCMVMPLDAIDGFLFKFYEKILVIPGGYHEEKLNDGEYFFEKWSAHRNIHFGFFLNACLLHMTSYYALESYLQIQ